MAGLPKSYIKKYGISKKAWAAYRADRKKGKTNKSASSSTPKRRKRPMVKKKTNRRRGFLNVSTFFKFIKIGAFVAPAVHAALSRDNNRDRLSYGLEKYTGYNINGGYFRAESLLEGWGPYIATLAITAGVQKLGGLIRRL